MKPGPIIAALVLASLSGCAPPDEPYAITFVARYEGQPINCVSGSPRLTDLRFYIHDVDLIRTDGERTRARLAYGSHEPDRRVELIDLENGLEGCANGTRVDRINAAAWAPPGDYKGLEFTLGVPFNLNHQDPLSAEAPLGDPDMHWHWRGGYKFMRAGISSGDDHSWLHLGSTGCEGTIQNITGCASPNRVRVSLPAYVSASDLIGVHLDPLLALEEGAGIVSCSSGPAEAACDRPMTALGLQGNQEQQIFRVEPRL